MDRTGITMNWFDLVGATNGEGKAKSLPSFALFFEKYRYGLSKILQALPLEDIQALVADLLAARMERRQIFIFGNGGSAASSLHMATDLANIPPYQGVYPFRVVSLNGNVSHITALANDLGYEKVFEAQLKNLLQPGDLVIAISSSGNSENVIRAVNWANNMKGITYGIVGFDGGCLKESAGRSIHIQTEIGQYGFMEDAVSVISHMVSVYIRELDREKIV
ncbi:MAG: SIS domain-containing protein [Candidatus Dadabacteria bacterium]|nr:MAG: SIS domain-containing protein [Candidatus Dadabacteria bacterium]